MGKTKNQKDYRRVIKVDFVKKLLAIISNDRPTPLFIYEAIKNGNNKDGFKHNQEVLRIIKRYLLNKISEQRKQKEDERLYIVLELFLDAQNRFNSPKLQRALNIRTGKATYKGTIADYERKELAELLSISPDEIAEKIYEKQNRNPVLLPGKTEPLATTKTLKVSLPAQSTLRKDKDTLNQLYFQSYITNKQPTYSWEQCLLWVIDYFHKDTVTKVTMCLDDLSLIFKIIPTLIHFIKVEKKQLHLIYAPQHAYNLFAAKELPVLWRMGISTTLFNFKETLNDQFEKGFFFNWVPDPKLEIIDKKRLSNDRVEIIRISTNSFDRYPIGQIIDHDQMDDIHKTITSIHTKIRNKDYSISLTKKSINVTKIEQQRYIDWYKAVIAKHKNSVYTTCTTKIGFLNLNDIQYRFRRFTRYRLYQAYKILSHEKIKDARSNSHLFYPHNIFDNGIHEYMPTNPPIVEKNPFTHEWELTEGHHRLLASWMLGEKKVQVLQVTDIPYDAYAKSSTTEVTIDSDWNKALDYIIDFHRLDEHIYKHRHIERITHNVDLKIYKDLADFLLKKEFINETDVKHFIGERYIPDLK